MSSHQLPLGATQMGLAQLNERSREIFRLIVESYLATGEPVGSRNLSRILPMTLSPASVRNPTPPLAVCRPRWGFASSSMH